MTVLSRVLNGFFDRNSLAKPSVRLRSVTPVTSLKASSLVRTYLNHPSRPIALVGQRRVLWRLPTPVCWIRPS